MAGDVSPVAMFLFWLEGANQRPQFVERILPEAKTFLAKSQNWVKAKSLAVTFPPPKLFFNISSNIELGEEDVLPFADSDWNCFTKWNGKFLEIVIDSIWFCVLAAVYISCPPGQSRAGHWRKAGETFSLLDTLCSRWTLCAGAAGASTWLLISSAEPVVPFVFFHWPSTHLPQPIRHVISVLWGDIFPHPLNIGQLQTPGSPCLHTHERSQQCKTVLRSKYWSPFLVFLFLSWHHPDQIPGVLSHKNVWKGLKSNLCAQILKWHWMIKLGAWVF